MDCQWNQKSFVFDKRQSVKAYCILYKCFHFTTQQRKPLSVLEGKANNANIFCAVLQWFGETIRLVKYENIKF